MASVRAVRRYSRSSMSRRMSSMTAEAGRSASAREGVRLGREAGGVVLARGEGVALLARRAIDLERADAEVAPLELELEAPHRRGLGLKRALPRGLRGVHVLVARGDRLALRERAEDLVPAPAMPARGGRLARRGSRRRRGDALGRDVRALEGVGGGTGGAHGSRAKVCPHRSPRRSWARPTALNFAFS